MMRENLKQKTVNGFFWSSIERFSVQAVVFVTGLIITRLLTPADYGLIAMITVFMAICNSVIDSGFSSALIRKINHTHADASTVFYFNIFVSLFCYLLLYVSAPYIADFYNIEKLSFLIRIVGLSVVIGAFGVVQNTLLTVRLDFKALAKISFISTILSGVAGIWLAYHGYGVWALIWQTLISVSSRVVLIWFFSAWRPIRVFSSQSLREMAPFGSRILFSGILEVVYTNIYSLIIGKFYPPANLGLYSKADQLAVFPSSNLVGIFRRVTFPVLSALQDDDKQLKISFIKLLKMLSFIIFPVMIGLAAVARPLIGILLTPEWMGIVPLFQVMCLGYVWMPLHVINVNMIEVKGRYNLLITPQIIKKVLGVGLLVATLPYGVTAIAAGTVVYSVLSAVINFYYTSKVVDVKIREQLLCVLPIFANSLVMGALAFGATYLFDSYVAKLGIGIGIGVGYYLLSSRLINPGEIYEVKSVIKNLRAKNE